MKWAAANGLAGKSESEVVASAEFKKELVRMCARGRYSARTAQLAMHDGLPPVERGLPCPSQEQ